MVCVFCGLPCDDTARCTEHLHVVWRGCCCASDAERCMLPPDHRGDHQGPSGQVWTTGKEVCLFANPSTAGIDTARIVAERLAAEALAAESAKAWQDLETTMRLQAKIDAEIRAAEELPIRAAEELPEELPLSPSVEEL